MRGITKVLLYWSILILGAFTVLEIKNSDLSIIQKQNEEYLMSVLPKITLLNSKDSIKESVKLCTRSKSYSSAELKNKCEKYGYTNQEIKKYYENYLIQDNWSKFRKIKDERSTECYRSVKDVGKCSMELYLTFYDYEQEREFYDIWVSAYFP